MMCVHECVCTGTAKNGFVRLECLTVRFRSKEFKNYVEDFNKFGILLNRLSCFFS